MISKIGAKMNNKKGFSLIELTFSLLIIGLGVLVIFQVFPLGITEGKNSIGDARALEFSQNLFSTIRYEVNQLTPSQWEGIVDDWEKWNKKEDDETLNTNPDEMFDPLGSKIQIPDGSGGSGTYTIVPANYFHENGTKRAGVDYPLKYPEGSEPIEYLKYRLCYRLLGMDHCTNSDDDDVIQGSVLMVVYLEVSYGKLITNHTKTFYTCICYKTR